MILKNIVLLLSRFYRSIGCFHWKMQLRFLDFGEIGDNVILNRGNFLFPQNIFIGDDVYLGPDAFLSSFGSLTFESGVITGPKLSVYTANHRFENARAIPYDDELIVQPVTIGANSWVGGGVTLLPGVVLGEGCVVGAGSVVTKTFPAGSVIAGNPARLIKTRNMTQYYRLKGENRIYLRLKANGTL